MARRRGASQARGTSQAIVEVGLDRRHEGTGLGLTLVVALAELHGAVFKLDSKPGAGTRASVIFPSRRTIGGPVMETAAAASAEGPENQSAA